MNEIKDLRDGLRKVDVVGIVTKVYPPRDVRLKTGENTKVYEYQLDDASSSIKVTVWGKDLGLLAGDKVEVKNGYVTSFRGTLQLNTGKFGEIVKVP